jgi:predicted DNA-binding protein
MRHSAVPLSIRLPEGADMILDNLVKRLHITKGQFVRNAVIEKIEDALDIKAIEDVLARNEKTYSLDEVKRELGLDD